jgi:uncharacterized protein (TIGR03435 family)
MATQSLLLFVIAGFIGSGFAAAAQVPAFEVASVKPANTNTLGMSVETNRGRFVARGATLGFLLQYAYRLQPFQISGGPDWLDSEKFEVQARFDANENADNDNELMLMLQTLLADRFKLRFHRETRDLPVYELVLAKKGPKLSPSREDTAPSMRGAAGQLIARHASIANLAGQLKRGLGRDVINKTDLQGFFDFNLTFAPNENAPPGPGRLQLPADPNGPSLFTALQEQLGLRLQAARGRVEIFVVDRAEKPSDN